MLRDLALSGAPDGDVRIRVAMSPRVEAVTWCLPTCELDRIAFTHSRSNNSHEGADTRGDGGDSGTAVPSQGRPSCQPARDSTRAATLLIDAPLVISRHSVGGGTPQNKTDCRPSV